MHQLVWLMHDSIFVPALAFGSRPRPSHWKEYVKASNSREGVHAGGEQENGPGARHLNVTLPAHVFSVAPAAGHTDVTVHLLNARV